MNTQESSNADRPSDEQGSTRGTQAEKSFPTQTVVGVIDKPDLALAAARALRADGLESEILCSERGVALIENAGGSRRDVDVIRAVQSLFGYEADHASRHKAELGEGHFIVLAESGDDETTERIRGVFEAHGGHFVNYYSRWTSRSLIP